MVSRPWRKVQLLETRFFLTGWRLGLWLSSTVSSSSGSVHARDQGHRTSRSRSLCGFVGYEVCHEGKGNVRGSFADAWQKGGLETQVERP
jgi:hypothetical protein